MIALCSDPQTTESSAWSKVVAVDKDFCLFVQELRKQFQLVLDSTAKKFFYENCNLIFDN